MRRILITMLLGVLLAVPGAIHAQQPSILPRFEESPCPATLSGRSDARCGYLIVPEDRRKPDGNLVRVAVGIVKSQSVTPAPDPVIMLNGGPGNSSMWRGSWLASSLYLTNRDVIVLDQRGTGFSQPTLDCPELAEVPVETLTRVTTFEAAAAYHTERAMQCHARLRSAGIDPGMYTYREIARDLEDLRKALGYGQVNLFGWSAGARLALTYMRDFPASARAAVLDSVYMPYGLDYYAELTPNAAKTFEALFDSCAADRRCQSAYPDLRTLFFHTVDRLNANPAEFTATNPVTKQRYQAQMNGIGFVGLIYRMMYVPDNLPIIPRLIASVNRGTYSALPSLLIEHLEEPEKYQVAMNHAIHCTEAVPFTSAQAIAKGDQSVDPRYRGFYHWDVVPYAFLQFCKDWISQPAQSIDSQPVRSAIPTLILAGKFDPASPPEHARFTAKALTNSYVFEFPTMAHFTWAFGGVCPKRMVAAFLNTPTQAPDSACIDEMAAVRFMVDADVSEVGGVYGFAEWVRRVGFSGREFWPMLVPFALGAMLIPILIAIRLIRRKTRISMTFPAHILALAILILNCVYVIAGRLMISHAISADMGILAFGVPSWFSPLLIIPPLSALLGVGLLFLTLMARRWWFVLRIYYLLIAISAFAVLAWLAGRNLV